MISVVLPLRHPEMIGAGEVLLIGIACIVAVMPVAAALGAWLRRRRGRSTQRHQTAKPQK